MSVMKKLDALVHHPAAALEEISTNRHLGLGLLGYAASAFSWVFLANIEGGATLSAFLTGWVMVFLIMVLAGFFFAAGAQLFLDFMTKKGSSLGLFSIIGISGLADTLFVGFSLIANARPELHILSGVFILLALALKLFFLMFLISKAYQTSKIISFMSLLLSLLPMAVMFFIGVFSIFFSIGLLIKSLV